MFERPAYKTFFMLLGFAVLVVLLMASSNLAQAQRGAARAAEPAAVEQGIAVYFSPNGGAIAAIAQLVGKARKTIDVQAFILSTSLVGRPLADAARRGVNVRIIFDQRQAEQGISIDEELAKAGAQVFYDNPVNGGINHNKVILIDNDYIITGSFNFTRTAEEKNVENMIVMRGKRRLMAAYRANFQERLKVSKSRQN